MTSLNVATVSVWKRADSAAKHRLKHFCGNDRA